MTFATLLIKMPFKSVFNWSGGKDSALALYNVQRNPEFSVEKLLTTMNVENDRISMHGVRAALLEAQAGSIGIPLHKIELGQSTDAEEYNRLMSAIMLDFKSQGYTHSIFGDIFLEDLRKYRETRLSECGFLASFPLWQKNTKALMSEFLEMGFKTIVVCVKEELLDKSFAGRIIDESFLDDLPTNVDPCGENGEFHTFVFDGPLFKKPIQFEIGDLTYRQYPSPIPNDSTKKVGFYFRDLIPQ